jgi:hypothetical protein
MSRRRSKARRIDAAIVAVAGPVILAVAIVGILVLFSGSRRRTLGGTADIHALKESWVTLLWNLSTRGYS